MTTPASSSIRVWDVVGESHHLSELHRIIRRNCHGSLPDSDEITVQGRLVREPNNRHDPQAVAVQIDHLTVGYIARGETSTVHDLFALLDSQGTPKRKWYRPGASSDSLPVEVCLGWHRLDRIGASVTLWVNEVFPDLRDKATSETRSTPANAPSGEALPAAWYADPDGGGGYRYWNGQEWTEQRAEEVPSAGWYPDPDGKRKQRWWDGARWTDSYSTDWVASCHMCEWQWAKPSMERSVALDSAENHRRAFRHNPYIWRLDGRFAKNVEWPPLD